MQLEQELALRRAEIKNLQAQLGGSDPSLQPSASDGATGPDAEPGTLLTREHEDYRESGQSNEKYEAALAASQQEIDSLRAVVDRQNQEISEMKQKVQQATKENMEMMDTWKVLIYVFLLSWKSRFVSSNLNLCAEKENLL